MYSITADRPVVYTIDLSEMAHRRVCGVGTCEATVERIEP